MSYKKTKVPLKLIVLFLFLILFSLNVFNIPIVVSSTEFNSQELKTDIQKVAPKTSQLTERIAINNWSAARAAGICTGSGTVLDPYVIQDFIIDGNGTGIGISIGGSRNDYFRIQNCTIFNCTYGIRLTWSSYGTLGNNNCSYNENGIYLDGWTDIHNPSPEIIALCYSKFITLSNNMITHNEQYGLIMRNCDKSTINGNILDHNFDGMYLTMSCDRNTIQDNILRKNERHGINLLDGSNNIIKGNKMESCGFHPDFDAFVYNNIDATNLVNNGHLYYYANRTNLNEDDFASVGQVYLINCNQSTISNSDLSDGSLSISLLDCNDIKILQNNLSSNSLNGIYASNCQRMTIDGNIINHNLEEGVFFSWSKNNSFLNNIIKSNGFRGGIRGFGFCDNNTFLNNRFKNNLEGLSFGMSCINNIITENVFISNQLSGITFEGGCEFNLLFSNFFRKNGLHTNVGLNNKWNNSEIGNYWDNYTGTDINEDGIGDYPHVIDTSPLVIDHLPIVDNDPPEISILLPYNNSTHGGSAPNYNLSINEKYIDEVWYSLDGGLTNVSITNFAGTIDQTEWEKFDNGEVLIRFYVLDKVGNYDEDSVLIIKHTSQAETIHGYHLILFIFAICVISANFLRKRLKPRTIPRTFK